MQVGTLPNGDTIRLGDMVDGSYWSATGEFDVTGPVIGWGPDWVAIAYDTGSVQCDPDQVRLAVGVAR
jgi:hypothetical protein